VLRGLNASDLRRGTLWPEGDWWVGERTEGGGYGVCGGVNGPHRGGRVVGGTGSEEGRKLIRVSEAGFVTVVEALNLPVEVLKVLIHDTLQPLCQMELFSCQLVCPRILFADNFTVVLLFGVRLRAAINPDPFLDLGVLIIYDPEAFRNLAVFVGDFLLDELDLLGKVGDAVRPVEDEGGIEGFDRRHGLSDEVDGEIVSRHDCQPMLSLQ
jgi:hypothetical protein